VNELTNYAFRICYQDKLTAFTHFNLPFPDFESLASINHKRSWASQLVLGTFADESELSVFKAFLDSIPDAVEIRSISEDEFLAAPSDHTWFHRRYQ
jgi:hypothetical protein